MSYPEWVEQALNEQSSKSPKPKKKMHWLIIALLVVIGLALTTAISGAAVFYIAKAQFENSGPDPLEPGAVETIISVPKGTGVAQIANNLERDNLISNALLFRLGVRLYGADQQLKAGEYAIPANSSMHEIMEILREGKAILHKLTVAEGLTSAQAMRLVEAHEILKGEMPETPAEGTILPETYLFPRGTTRAELVAQMQDHAKELMDELWPTRAEDLPVKTKEDALILASIVEKETGIAEERPRVAAVFVNRMRRGMRLESDPTIIYGLTGGEPLGRGLRRSELDKPNPYSTYQIDGLPPTPIANPGRDSIAAVLNPPETKDLYFVADGSGGHAFATNYNDHRRNVAKWRKVERERKSAQ